jgi:hypothetical protein
MGAGSFPRVKRPGRGADHPPPSKVPRSTECRAIPLPPLRPFESVTGCLYLSTRNSNIEVPDATLSVEAIEELKGFSCFSLKNCGQ